MFNLKKESQVKFTEKMLKDKNDEYSYAPPKNPVITDKLLRDTRKNIEGDKIGEGQLEDSRVAPKEVITEAQLNAKDKVYNDKRRVDNIPLMDYYQKTAKDVKTKYEKENKPGNTEKDFWDYYVDTGKPKITNNVQPSQMVTNYETRDAFNKANPSKKIASTLKDADAMLYHIYRTATEESRELNKEEQQTINNINGNKMVVMSQSLQEIEKEISSDITSDDLDIIAKELKEYEEYKKKHPDEFLPEDKKNALDDTDISWSGDLK